MSFKNVILFVAALISCLLSNVLADRRPNIVIVMADDLGWNDVSFHGSNQFQTPNIDALAYNGIILNSHYVPALCTPSRASLLTGKYPTSMGMQHLVILSPEPWGLPLEETLMPQHLKRHGYSTHVIGKWHLGFHEKEYTPLYRGFDSHFGYWNGFQDYYDHTMQSGPFKGYDMRRGLEVDYESQGRYSTDAFTEEAVNIIENHNSTQGPLFLYLAHLAPHAANPDEPFQAPEEEIAKHAHIKDPERRVFAAMVTKLDDSLGKVVTALKNSDMLDNSIILFLSDNGAVTHGMHSNKGSNYPLRGLKETPWEGGIRNVAAVWSPLLNRSQRVSNQMMHMSDWLPTLYSAAGLNTSELGDIDGVDMWNALSNDLESPRTEVFNNYDEIEDYSSLRVGNWKFVEGTAQLGEFDEWYGDSGDEVKRPYELSKIFESETHVAVSDYLKEKQEQQFSETAKTSQFITKESILNMRKNSILTCDYPLFSSLALITDNHTEPVDLSTETNKLRSENPEIKSKIIRELEKMFENFSFESKVFVFSESERQHLENLIESGELVNAFKCDPVKKSCMFNLRTDPCERINLAEIFPDRLRDMKTRLEELKKSVAKPLNQPDDPFANPDFHNGTWVSWCDVRKERASQTMTRLAHSLSSALNLDHLVILENPFFKNFLNLLFLTAQEYSIIFIQLPAWFFWLLCCGALLFTTKALIKLTNTQTQASSKDCTAVWENFSAQSIVNLASQSHRSEIAKGR